ncbi:MAG TPA: succinyl-diaminopimelate desuccinylase [Gammaproteobacteria bacterium]|nr:succinyl-diaminopimelate desuccinylase [Gammaproteobacteria bacterium]
MNFDALQITRELIGRRSVTPSDAQCQDLMIEFLEPLGFNAERMPFGAVSNFWARRGTAAPVVVFAGHTDVVPPGDVAGWDHDPFEPTQTADGRVIGRGAADMKASLAAMLTATARFVAEQPHHAGTLAYLITSDEEGPAHDGTIRVIETLRERGERIDYCIIGEPSSDSRLGDTVRNGRRGSLSGIMRILGAQGHVAYPLEKENPMHALARFVEKMSRAEIDNGNAHFPPTTFQMVHVHCDAGAPNIVPAELSCRFNFRYNTQWTRDSLQAWVERMLEDLGIEYEIDWRLAGEPFITEPGPLTDAVLESIREVTGVQAQLSTSGGTSDGRFIAPHGIDVVEIGPINHTIHKVNEEVRIDDIYALEEIYLRTLRRLLC